MNSTKQEKQVVSKKRYGIDILEDNVVECRKRLFDIFDQRYTELFKKETKDSCRESVRFILERNILWGDALTLKSVGDKPQPIFFSEWSPVNGSMIKRRDYMLSFLLEKKHQLLLFSDEDNPAYINEPVREFPLIHYLRIAYAEQQ